MALSESAFFAHQNVHTQLLNRKWFFVEFHNDNNVCWKQHKLQTERRKAFSTDNLGSSHVAIASRACTWLLFLHRLMAELLWMNSKKSAYSRVRLSSWCDAANHRAFCFATNFARFEDNRTYISFTEFKNSDCKSRWRPKHRPSQ